MTDRKSPDKLPSLNGAPRFDQTYYEPNDVYVAPNLNNTQYSMPGSVRMDKSFALLAQPPISAFSPPAYNSTQFPTNFTYLQPRAGFYESHCWPN